MKHIKMIGLVALSAMALVAFVGTASASASQFTAGSPGATLSTKTLTKEVFTITGSEVKCATTKFEGVAEVGATQRVHPVYNECEAFGINSGVSITTTGCDYVFSANTTSGEATVNLVDSKNATCNGIVITADPIFTTCSANVPKQEIKGAATYTNSGSAVKVKAVASEISTNVTASNGLCPLTTGAHTGASGGTYNGESEVSASGGVNWDA